MGSDNNEPPERPAPKKYKGKAKRENEKVIRGLFGEQTLREAKERDAIAKRYDGKRGPRKTPPRRRVRIGAGWTEIMANLEAEGKTMEDFVRTLTPEELARGQVRNADGSFIGQPPKWVPKEFYTACIRELLSRGKTLYQENYLMAIEAMTQIAVTPSVDVNSRIRAAQFVIERIEGKVPEKLEIGVSEPWQELLAGIVVEVPDNIPMRKFAESHREDVEGESVDE